MKTYKYYSDAGHGWVAVKRKELISLGLLNNISPYSYQRGQTVYLEEDRDAAVFFKALYDQGKVRYVDWTFDEKVCKKDRSPIRSYEGFSV